jgi:hypothetical protein
MTITPQVVHHYYTTFTNANPNGVVPLGYRCTGDGGDFLNGGIDMFREPEAPAAAVADADTDTAIDVADAAVASGGGVDQDQTDAAGKRARGEFVRGVSAHRNWLGDEAFPIEANRYVLFVANNCPWCHRTMMGGSLDALFLCHMHALLLCVKPPSPRGKQLPVVPPYNDG